MTCSEEVAYVFDRARALLDVREEVYGEAWKLSGKDVCVSQVFRKANYIRVQWENGRMTTEKLLEDLLDLINWGACSYKLLEEKE